jgi:LysM repeat protein
MNTPTKSLVIIGLIIAIFGGGGFAAYELFFKKPGPRKGDNGQAVVTPTPDQGVPLFDQAKQQLAKGDVGQARTTLVTLIQTFPASNKVQDAQKSLGDLNIRQFFSSEPGPDKTEYTVVRGDSIAKIARKTKAPEELIFKANGLDNLTIQPGQKFIIPTGQFSLVINTKAQDVTLLNHDAFFKRYKPVEVKLPPRLRTGQFKVLEKVAWFSGGRVAFGDKNYLGSSRWIVVNESGVTLYSETNPQTPNVQPPNTGIILAPEDMEELFALVGRDTPVIIQ